MFTLVIIATLTDCRLMRFNTIRLEIESENSEVIEISFLVIHNFEQFTVQDTVRDCRYGDSDRICHYRA